MEPLEEVKTAEQVASSIKAAYDSVNLINEVIAGTAMVGESAQEKKDCVDRNVGHLKIMTGKTWFNDGLTAEQVTEIDTVITDGEAYIAA